MATATRTPDVPPALAAAVQAGRITYRLSLEQYHRMAETGILTKHDRIVLLDGVLVEKMTKGDPHIASVKLTYEALRGVVPADWHVCKEDPIALPAGSTGHDSEPEPDISVIRGTIRDYTARKAYPEDVALVVEVAESSLRADRAGLARYAWAGIPVVWIVNLVARVVEVYTEPTGPGADPRYRTARTFEGDATVPVVIDGREVGAVAAGPPALTLWSNRAIRSLLFATMARQFQVGRSNPRTRRGGDSWRASRGHMAT